MSFPLFAFWLLLVWSLGWLFFPVSRRIFGGILPDEGLAVGRILALCLWTFAAFFVARLGMPISVCAWFFLPIFVVGIWLWKRERAQLDAVFKSRKRAIWSGELLFLSVFLIGFFLRGFWSDTEGTNGEKGMDSILIASLARAQKLPAPNPYAAGAEFNSYYYFGHLETALLTRATGTTTRWSYNLMCATIPALCVSALFSLGAVLTKQLWGGAFVCFAVLFLGTLSPLYQWTHPDPWSAGRFLRLDFFGVSRVIPYTINEFPFFTFNQGDLHAHYFNFQFQIAALCLGFALFCRPNRWVVAMSALILGAMICTNTWDFPAYFLLCVLGLGTAKSWRPSRKALGVAAIFLGALALASTFVINLKSAASGPKLAPQPASPFREWLLMWGVLIGSWALFVSKTALSNRRNGTVFLLGLAAILAIGFWRATWLYPPGTTAPLDLEALAAWKSFANPSWLVWPTMLLCSAGAILVLRKTEGETRFLGALALAGLFSLVYAELSWAGFIGSPDHPAFDDFKRQDTVFKFGLQTWFLWGTACAAGGFLTFKKWPLPFQILVFPLFLTMTMSSVAVVHGRTRGFSQFDAWDSWAHLASPEKEAALWLEANTRIGENILEAEPLKGGDFSKSPRFAHATGISTVVGPLAHTFYWAPANARDGGKEWENVYERKKDARAIYENTGDRRALLRKYGVKFIIWGELERGSQEAPEYAAHAEFSLKNDLNLRVAAQFGEAGDPRRVEIFEVVP